MKPATRILLSTVLILILFFSGFTMSKHQAPSAKMDEKQITEDNDAYEINGPLTLTIILEKMYLDGKISEEIVTETILSMEDFWHTYADWQLVQQDDEQVVFKKMIDDISPTSKSKGYFGITKDGTLTIFEGKPKKSSKIIQTFFQIDLGKLESYQHKLLKKGIPVKSKDHFEEVIKTFKQYSTTTIN